MRNLAGFFSRCVWRNGLGLAALGVLLGQGMFGQQFADREMAKNAVCLGTVDNDGGSAAGRASCDSRTVAELAKSGQAFEENQLGIESALVLGSGKTIRDARNWFEKAARQGYAPAQVNLAVLYLNGWGMEKNYGAALYWLNEAAKQKNMHAHTNLGILYLNGWGVRQDYAEAATHFRLAAEHGDTSAMVDLGFLSDAGLGTAQDKSQAARWYRLAAERGDALGQNNLADLYLRGDGLAQSESLALAWFEKSAAQGNTGARIKLGYLYGSGRAGRTDVEKAYALILAAELAGDARGREYLEPLEKQMGAEQLARAKEKARDMAAIPLHAKMAVAFLR